MSKMTCLCGGVMSNARRAWRIISVVAAAMLCCWGAVVGYFGLMLVAHSCVRGDSYKYDVAYSTEAVVDGFTFQVELFRNHERLAEYRKVLNVKRGNEHILKREFIDTGGLASLYFLRHGNDVTVLDGIRNGFVLDVATGLIHPVDLNSVPEAFPDESFGRFMFVYEKGEQIYRWVLKKDLPVPN